MWESFAGTDSTRGTSQSNGSIASSETRWVRQLGVGTRVLKFTSPFLTDSTNTFESPLRLSSGQPLDTGRW